MPRAAARAQALRLFPVSIIMPILQIVWVLFSIVSGSLYYQEYKTLDALSGSMFGVGIVIMIIGILFLTSGQRQPQVGCQLLGPGAATTCDFLAAAR